MTTVEIDDDALYSTEDVADMLRISRASVAKMCDAGILKSHRMPPLFKRRRVMGGDLREFYQKRMPTTAIRSVSTIRDRLVQSVRDFVTESDHREYGGESVQRARALLDEIGGEKK